VSRIDMRAVLDIARVLREAARAEIMPRFRRLGARDVHMKTGPLDLVTVADVAAEHVIAAGLRRLFPGSVVVGEEATAADWPAPSWRSWSIRWTAPPTMPRGCRCSAPWRRRSKAAKWWRR
jgi:fructose-1,6-bisphosphatase/inositol monophosphatase family enzyme